MKKKPAKTATKEWWQKLDEYAKLGMTKQTPPKERICVVNGNIKQGENEAWVWYEPYWVAGQAKYDFDSQMRKTGVGTWHCLDDVVKVLDASGASRFESKAYAKSIGAVPVFRHLYGRELMASPNDCFTIVDVDATDDGDCESIQFLLFKHHDHTKICPHEGVRVFKNTQKNLHRTLLGPEESVSFLHIFRNRDKYMHCVNCGHYHAIPDMVDHVFTGGILGHGTQKICQKCQTSLMEKEVIRNHDDSNFLPPMPDYEEGKLRGETFKKPKRRMFGVEVELGFDVGDRVKNALDVQGVMGRDFAYIKHDGSITKPELEGHTKMGFEIVTAPAGINVHRERWKALANAKAYKTFRSWNTGTCGFHVHVSRDSLTQFQIGRILVFINHPNNRYFIEVVAGRSTNSYTKFIDKRLSDGDKVDTSKYMAVRTNKEKSIEFRVFRGTHNYRHIIRNIEFCEAVCDFCAPCQQSLMDMYDFRKFIAFVKSRPGQYPLLEEWLGTIDLIAKKPIPKDDKFFKPAPIEESVDARVAKQLAEVLSHAGPTKPTMEVVKKKKKKIVTTDEVNVEF